MFNNVLVGVDGRDGGRDAIALAGRLAHPQATITLSHVYSTGRVVGRGGVLALPFDQDDSHRLLEAERATAGIHARLVSWAQVPPARGLHELAAEIGADLLVVGSSRHSVLGHVFMGDDARATLGGAPCAVAVAPRGYRREVRPVQSIGVGYDASAESTYALNVARELADRVKGSVRALWVVSPDEVRARTPLPAGWPQAAGHLIEERTSCLGRLGVEGAAMFGAPAEELARFSADVDLLVTGSRGYGPVGRLVHGSVSNHLVRNVVCPLLVLPRAVLAATGDEAVPGGEMAGVA